MPVSFNKTNPFLKVKKKIIKMKRMKIPGIKMHGTTVGDVLIKHAQHTKILGEPALPLLHLQWTTRVRHR